LNSPAPAFDARVKDPPTFGETSAPLVLRNPQQDLAALAPLLLGEVRRGSWLDAFLLAAGLNQIVDDRLNPEIYPFDQAAEYLNGRGPLGSSAGLVATALGAAYRTSAERRSVTRRVVRWKRDAAQIVQALAEILAADERRRRTRTSSCSSHAAPLSAAHSSFRWVSAGP